MGYITALYECIESSAFWNAVVDVHEKQVELSIQLVNRQDEDGIWGIKWEIIPSLSAVDPACRSIFLEIEPLYLYGSLEYRKQYTHVPAAATRSEEPRLSELIRCLWYQLEAA
jgi:hypothetical protein